ncbi:MAG: glutamate formimidoyltransferase [Anaerolineales bacterium]|nr:MAG: glutamate formimidoyltransferase [Anaerolineales bacterium]
MARRIIECIPNFSEGRHPEVIDAIETAIVEVPGILLLDRHIDTDHNRSVVTFAGPPEAVAQAAFSSIKVAAELIDLDHHQGEHPRIGATDVVPFVPISGVTMAECVAMAHALGKRVGDELGIPVYLYEKAATRPDRVNLEDIRRGEYEGLKETIGVDPDRAPDYGPNCLGTAGATVIGARHPLIAFNVYLTTEDVSIAKKIARAIRYSSGGLPFVKALGMLVEDRAQVSMNLTDFTQTPVFRVVETIRGEAAQYGVTIHHSELVGLIPQSALVDSAQWYLQLDQFELDQVLETRLYNAIKDEPSFLEQLAAGTPTPSGGAAAAYAGAMAAALVAMVARLTLGKKKYEEVQDRMSQIASQADDLRVSLEGAASLDAQAFNAVIVAHRMPKGSKVEKTARSEAIERATHRAAIVPLQIARQATSVLKLATEVAETGNVNAVTDAGSAGAIAQAALRATGLNVRINASNVSNREAADEWLQELAGLETQAQAAEAHLHAALKERAGLEA